MRLLQLILLFTFAVGLHSQSFDEYLKEAEENNLTLKAKYKEYEQSLLQAPQVSAMPNPTLNVGVFATRPYTRLGPQNYKLSIAQKLPWFGTLGKYEQESLELAEAKRLDYEELKDEIFFQIRENMIELNRVAKKAEYTQQSLSLFEYLRPIVKTKVEVNEATLTELLKLDLKISELKTELELLNLELLPLKYELKQLLNRESSEAIAAPKSIEIGYDRDDFANRISTAPTMMKLEQLKQASNLRAEVANSESNPEIVIGLDYVNLSPMENMQVENNGMDIFMPMVGISIPFFNGSYAAKEEQSIAMSQQYEYEQADLSSKLFAEYESIDAKIKTENKKEDLYKKQIEKSEQIRELIIEAYSVSANQDIDEIIEIENSVIDYKLKMIEAESISEKMKAQLLKIVGE